MIRGGALTGRQERFIAEYVVDLNATQAAIRAGYSPRSAYRQGADLLKKHHIATAVEEEQRKRLEATRITAEEVLRELGRLAFSNLVDVFAEDGSLKWFHEIPEHTRRAIASVEVVRRNIAGGDGHSDQIHKVKLWDKPKALEMLAKHFVLLTEQVEHSGDVSFRWRSVEDEGAGPDV